MSISLQFTGHFLHFFIDLLLFQLQILLWILHQKKPNISFFFFEKETYFMGYKTHKHLLISIDIVQQNKTKITKKMTLKLKLDPSFWEVWDLPTCSQRHLPYLQTQVRSTSKRLRAYPSTTGACSNPHPQLSCQNSTCTQLQDN